MSIHSSILSNMNIYKSSWLIIIEFYLEHYWGGGSTALGFRPDRIRTLVLMATDSSHRVIMGGNLVATLASSILIDSYLFLQVMRTTIKKFESVRNSARSDQGLRSKPC